MFSMIGKTISHYRIAEKLGAGGMGEVYRAFDEHLQRDVAVKVLPDGVLNDEDARTRFRKEALALSRLNHQNIETVFDFDTQDCIDCLVMEYIPGQTLAQRLTAGSFPEKEMIKLGTQLAEGLAAAHEQGVIHRDLKPGNLMVTPDGRLKILDFGLAKLIQPLSETASTGSAAGTLVGTFPYMAPEQLCGESVDARTDLYAVGNVLYEIATGRRPFCDDTAPKLTESILHHDPVPPRAMNSRISRRLDEIIMKCLDKDPENRYQSARELLVDLRRISVAEARPQSIETATKRRWWVPAAVLASLILLTAAGYVFWRSRSPQAMPPQGKIMLAVLPFNNLSGDPEQEYFSDGLTEEMIAQLGGLAPERLGVIARTTVMTFKHTAKTIGQIAGDLKVHYILESSVRREADQVRVTAQLIQSSDQTHLWAKSYTHELTGVLRVQAEIARDISNSLALILLPGKAESPASRDGVNAEAFDLYLRGRQFFRLGTQDGLLRSLDYYQRALVLDPIYAASYSGIADSYVLLGGYGFLSPQATFPRAMAAAARALELNETLPQVHASLAYAKMHYDWDWKAAEREFRRAIELNPSFPAAHHWYALYLVWMGRESEALREIRMARECDPFSLDISINESWIHYFARDYNVAIRKLCQVLEIEPNRMTARYKLGFAYVQEGMYGRAILEFQEVQKSFKYPIAVLAWSYALAGNKTMALKIADEHRRSVYGGPDNYELALVHTALGNKEDAFQSLDKAYEEKNPSMVYIKVEPAFDSLRPDPRFQSLLRRMNLEQ
jgi:serine/threonine protein kinase/tetratricopeptide (TPR) repeat protein